MSSRYPGIAAGLILWGAVGCTTGKVRPEDRLVFQYAEGIQSLHQPSFDTLYGACHPGDTPMPLKERVAEYEALRRGGSVTFAPDGVAFIKLAALGRGAYFKVLEIHRQGGVLEFDSLVKPDYQSINYMEFPEGAVLYLLGEPLGAVSAVRPGGKDTGPRRNLLESVNLHWRWRYQGGEGSEERWCLESVQPDENSAVFRELQFRELGSESASPEPARPGPGGAS